MSPVRPPRVTRRRAVGSVCTTIGLLAIAPPAWATGLDELDRRVRSRLELWNDFARDTTNLIVRLRTVRESPWLTAPLTTTGTLVFRAAATLLLTDDDASGSTTWVEGETARVFAHRHPPSGEPSRLTPAEAWVAGRLLALFAPGEPTTLLDDAEVHVPRTRAHRLELVPAAPTVRSLVQALTVQLEPVEGAVTELQLTTGSGDRLRIELTDHRKNVDDADVQAELSRVAHLAAPSIAAGL